MSQPDSSINNILNFQPVDNNEHNVDKTIQKIKRQIKQTRKGLFNDFGLKSGLGPKEWMNTIRIAPVPNSGAGSGTEQPDNPMSYTPVNSFKSSTAVDVDENVQAIKRVLETLRKKLFKDNNLDENKWMHTIRIAPRDGVSKQDPASCGCGS